MKSRYEELEGKEVLYVDGENRIPCIVAGCDPDIGLSLVAAVDTNRKMSPTYNLVEKGGFIFCSHGPLSPKYKDTNHPDIDGFRKSFEAKVQELQHCISTGAVFDKTNTKTAPFPFGCAFGA